MSYIDDWGQTPTDDRRRLEQACEGPACAHMRYQHGIHGRQSGFGYRGPIEHVPGPCTKCECTEFRGEPPITKDQVMDVAERLSGVTHLSDIGISGVSCTAYLTRHTGLGAVVLNCKLTAGHGGGHET